MNSFRERFEETKVSNGLLFLLSAMQISLKDFNRVMGILFLLKIAMNIK